MVVGQDQAVRGDTTLEQMKDLKPAYRPDGKITAGNSSPLNAAATSMILMSREQAKKKGIQPMATIRSIGFAGVDPTIMGAGPVPASKKALASAGLQVKDIDYWEINEAFAWMEQAVDHNDEWIHPLRAYPFLDPLRADPRFQPLAKKLSL